MLPLALVVAMSGACDRNPAAPSPDTPAGPAVTPYHISGVVTDEGGQRLSNVEVLVNHYDHLGDDGKPGYPVKVTRARTDGSGQYEMDIQAVPFRIQRPWLQNIIGDGFARIDTREYPDDFQFVTASTSIVIKNFRLNRFVTLAAGESATTTFLPDDGVCAWSDFQNTLCRYMRVTVPGDGTLTVSAAPLQGVTVPVSFVVLEGDDQNPWQGGSGTMNYPVKAGVEFLVAMQVPPGFSQARSYAITTSFRADGK